MFGRSPLVRSANSMRRPEGVETRFLPAAIDPVIVRFDQAGVAAHLGGAPKSYSAARS